MGEGFWIVIIVSGITGGCTILGVWITQYYQSKRTASEERRWYAEHFWERQQNALSNVFVALEDANYTLTRFGNYPPSTLQEFREKVEPQADVYLRSFVLASIYMNDEDIETMRKALGAFRQATMAIWLKLPDCPVRKEIYSDQIKNVDWDLLADAHNKAILCIRNKLNPKIIRDLLREPEYKV